MYTQWNVNQKMKILLKWVFSLYTEITLKSDLYFISSFPSSQRKSSFCYLKLFLMLCI